MPSQSSSSPSEQLVSRLPVAQTHVPEEQIRSTSHARPQSPQFSPSESVDTHSPSQRVVPEGHWHPPFEQASPSPHAVPQAPQFARSVARSTQLAPHERVPEGHTRPHVPAEQNSPAPHVVPHAPQFAGSVSRFAQVSPQRTRGTRHVPPSAVDVPPRAPESQPATLHAKKIRAASRPCVTRRSVPDLSPIGRTLCVTLRTR
jgi:hypothetical protein